MPTAPKLVSAVVFALLALIAAITYGGLLPEGMSLGYLPEYATAIGGLVGWFVMGRATGPGYGVAIGTGMRTALLTVFWVLLLFSIYLMIQKSTHMMYDGPMEAVLGIFEFMLEYGRKMISAEFLGVVLGGGAVCGLLAEMAGKRWS